MRSLYAIRDKKAETLLGNVVMMHNDVVATRMFKEAAASKDTPINKYPEDFELLRIAEIDEDSGAVKGYDTPSAVYDGSVWLAEMATQSGAIQAAHMSAANLNATGAR